MKPTLLLPILLGLLLLGGLGYFWMDSDDESQAALALGDDQALVPGLELESSELPSAKRPQPELGDKRVDALDSAREEAADLEVGPLRRVPITVAIPQGAAMGQELAVLAVSPESLESRGTAAYLSDLRQGRVQPIARAVVDSNGRAQLDVPEDQACRVLLDSRQLFLRERAVVEPGDSELALEAELGATLVVKLLSKGAADDSIEVSGMNWGQGRGGGSTRVELPADSVEPLFFGPLDPDYSWSMTPRLAEQYARAASGIRLEAGQERVIEVTPTAGGTVTGEVRDEQGQPLAQVRVRTTASPMAWMGTSQQRETTTDEDGKFSLRAIAPGDQQIEAELEGWPKVESEDFELADGEVKSGLLLSLQAGESIAGFVRWPDGKPAAGALVSAETTRSRGWGNWGGTQVVRVGKAETDEDGSFQLSGLEQGNYTVRAQLEKLGSSSEQAPLWRALGEAVASGTTSLNLELSGPIAFRGRVLDDRGQAVTQFEIELESAADGGPSASQEYRDEEGRFEFAQLGEGDWEVRVSAEGYVQTEVQPLNLMGGASKMMEIEVSVMRSASLSGRVITAFGDPIAGARVQADDGASAGNPWRGPQGPRSDSKQEGRFEFKSITPGTIGLTATLEGWADSEALSVQLTPGQVIEDLELVLREGGRIEGQVLTPDGDPRPGQRVTWGSNAMGFGSRGDTRTNSEGFFAFEHVTPGEWAVSATPSMEEMADQMQGRRDQSAFTDIMGQLITETVEVTDGETSEVFLGGEPRRPVKIVGRVTLAGEPVSEASVYAVSETSAVFQGMKSVQSDSDGQFEIVVDRPGPHTVSATKGELGVALAISVPDTDEVNVNLPIPLGRIAGTVRKPDGKAAPSVRIAIQREDGLGRMRWGGDQTRTNELGEYSIEALEPGRYTLRVNTSTWGGTSDLTWGTAIRDGIEVDEDENVSGIDFRLEQAGSIKGIVSGPDGKPLPKASVFFRDGAGRLVNSVSATSSNTRGEFRKEGLAPGSYSLSVRADGFASNDALRVQVNSGTDSEVNLRLDAGSYMLAMLDGDELQQVRARYEVFDEAGTEVGSLWSLEDLRETFNQGRESNEQRLGPFPPGKYLVRATLADGRVEEKRVTLRGRSSEKRVRLKFSD